MAFSWTLPLTRQGRPHVYADISSLVEAASSCERDICGERGRGIPGIPRICESNSTGTQLDICKTHIAHTVRDGMGMPLACPHRAYVIELACTSGDGCAIASGGQSRRWPFARPRELRAKPITVPGGKRGKRLRDSRRKRVWGRIGTAPWGLFGFDRRVWRASFAPFFSAFLASLAAARMSCPNVTALDSTRNSPKGPSGQQINGKGGLRGRNGSGRERREAALVGCSGGLIDTGLVRLSLDHASCRSWLWWRGC